MVSVPSQSLGGIVQTVWKITGTLWTLSRFDGFRPLFAHKNGHSLGFIINFQPNTSHLLYAVTCVPTAAKSGKGHSFSYNSIEVLNSFDKKNRSIRPAKSARSVPNRSRNMFRTEHPWLLAAEACQKPQRCVVAVSDAGLACSRGTLWLHGTLNQRQDPKLSAAQIPTEPQEAVPLGTGCSELLYAGLLGIYPASA